MKEKTIYPILLWLGFTLIGFLLLTVLGQFMPIYNNQWLRLFQFLSSVLTLLLPTIAAVGVWTKQPGKYLAFQASQLKSMYYLVPLLMILMIPAVNLLLSWNQSMNLPNSLQNVEEWMRNMEQRAEILTLQLLTTDSFGILLINLIVMAIAPAIAEECFFRGMLLQLFLGGYTPNHHSKMNKHIAIWLTAFIFSFIHFQFYGFLPRLFLGALFGYLFIWTQSIWIPIIAHATNNAMMVCTYFIMSKMNKTTDCIDTFGTGNTWYVGIISLALAIFLIGIIYRSTNHKGKQQ